MKRLAFAFFLSTFAAGGAFAQSCETKALSKEGKPLAGAAKMSFIKKCKTDACANKAVSSEGKPLSGAAKSSSSKSVGAKLRVRMATDGSCRYKGRDEESNP